MFERRIGEDAIRHVLETGEVIQNYPDYKPFPSSLLMGWYESRPIHVVIVRDNKAQIIIITAYKPDVDQWQSDFKRRKS
ncbi:MAG: DUF4258 domain-containing protein [Actinobacteria bacterium]|nr:DUF4258 domain-containing protein [Actinomycetota bacterium]